MPTEKQSERMWSSASPDGKVMLVIGNAPFMDQVLEFPRTSALRVLVIDDHQPHAEGLAELLQLAGFQAWFVLNGTDGIARAKELAVDAVLLDMNLPDMNGFEVCRRLRRDPKTAYIAVVFHTAQGSVPGARHEGDAFLTYPVAMSEVYSVIRASVERRRNKFGHLLEFPT